MTEAEKDKARVYLEEMDKADNLRLAREKARNDLETLLYKTKDVYYDEKDELLYASEKEVVEMKRVCDLISEWLEEHAETANTPQLEKYISTIEPLFRSIHQRKIEHDYRPSKLEALQNTLTSAEELVLQMAGSLKLAQSPGDADPSGRKAELAALYKQDELDMLTKKLADTTQWLNPLKAQQQALALNQDSVLTTVDLDAHNGHLKALLSKFSYADRVAKMEAEIIAKQKRETREREQKERLAAKEKARMVKLASEAAQAAETSNSDDPAIQETEDTHEEL